MANQKITELGANTAPAKNVLIPLVTDPGGTPVTEHATKRALTRPVVSSSTTASTLTPDVSVANVFYRTTQTVTLTIEAPTGTPVAGETIMIKVSSAAAQTLNMNSIYKPYGAAFPATTTAGKDLLLTATFNGTDWDTLWAEKV